jgi:hypothetical protein
MWRGKQCLSKAIEALARIDGDSMLVDRCVKYLQQLLRLTDDWCKLSTVSSYLYLPDLRNNVANRFPNISVISAGDGNAAWPGSQGMALTEINSSEVVDLDFLMNMPLMQSIDDFGNDIQLALYPTDLF